MSVDLKVQSKSKYILSKEEGRAYFEEAIPRMLGISADEFLRRYDAGEYADLPDTPEYWDIMSAAFLIPFGRQDS
jgi:hypothetical protein